MIISELINNINIVQCATLRFNSMNCNTSVKIFIQRLFSSKRHAFPNQQVANGNMIIRLGRKLKLLNDHPMMVHLYNTHVFNFDLYETCWKNNVRFNIIEFNSTNKTCDSCVLFKDQQQTSCGFIMGIIYDSKQECYMILHKVKIDRHGSFTCSNKHVLNPFIFWGNLTDPPEIMTVHLKDIIVKIAYSKQEAFHFYQYPNTVEST